MDSIAADSASGRTLHGFPVLETEDDSRCSTQKVYWTGVPPTLCGGTAVASALFGCEGENFVWGRVCAGCLDTARAGFHKCVRHELAHPLRVERVIHDIEGELRI